MKINLDDPNLTAYALGELPEPARAEMEKAVAASAEAQSFVRETREFATLLETDFALELKEAPRKAINIFPLPETTSFWSDARWLSIGVAAFLAVCAVVAAVALSGLRGNLQTSVADNRKTVGMPTTAATPAEVQMELLAEATTDRVIVTGSYIPTAESESALPVSIYSSESAPVNGLNEADKMATADYGHFEENPFLAADTNSLSTFSIDVDTASYANVRRMINAGTKPPNDAVRIEELINYFAYDYPQPESGQPFSINLEVAGCPWTPEHRLVRIGLKGREIASDQRGASNLVFLLDVSGSMEPANRLPLVKQAMRLLVDRLTENDRVAIVTYAGSSGAALPSTTGDRKEEIIRALENLEASGSTNGASGIALAYQIAAEHFIKGGVNRVILATDGDFNVGVTSPGELVRLAEEKAKGGIFLSVLGVGDDNLKDSTMQKLADKANGNYAYLDSLDEARKVLVAQVNGTLITIAKDVKVQVEFNPARVASYRLIGYEKRLLRKEDFNNDKVDAGEIGAGHTVTALYEIVPRGAGSDPAASVPPVDPLKYSPPNPMAVASSFPNSSPELMTVKLRYKEPDGDQSALLERSLADYGAAFENASSDFRFAAAVAAFGMVLRDSPYRGNATLAGVIDRAQGARGRDEAGYRAGFIALARRAQALAF
ncbi:MAG: VWA domain-containing protein [Chthoniobacterales bacterium]